MRFFVFKRQTKIVVMLTLRRVSRRVWFYQREVIKIHKSKKDKLHNGQKKRDKRTNNDLQTITQKTTNRATWNQLKPGMNSGAPEGKAVPAQQVAPVVLLRYVSQNVEMPWIEVIGGCPLYGYWCNYCPSPFLSEL